MLCGASVVVQIFIFAFLAGLRANVGDWFFPVSQLVAELLFLAAAMYWARSNGYNNLFRGLVIGASLALLLTAACDYSMLASP